MIGAPRETLRPAGELIAARDRTALLEVARDVAPRSLSAAWLAVVVPRAASVAARIKVRFMG